MSQDQRQTQRLVAVMASLMVTASLTACGGGSDAPAANAEPADKYVGTWTSSCQGSESSGRSDKFQFELSKGGGTAVNGIYRLLAYSNVTCTGSPAGSQSINFAFTIDSTGTAFGKVVDKTTVSQSFGGSGKQIFSVEGTVLYTSIGDPSPILDPDGYPTDLNLGRPYTR